MVQRIALAAALGLAGLGLAGCADRDGYGGGLGYGAYYGDGYGGDYAPAAYDEPYGYGYGGYGGYGFGWYGDFYYPGVGIYVYDRDRRPYRWTDGQRRYWQSRPGYGNPQVRSNWQAFGQEVRGARQDYRQTVRGDRQARQAGTITSDQFRAERQDARQDYRQSVRQDYGNLRQQNQAAGVATPHYHRSFGGGAPRSGGARGGGGRGRR